jgi:hypothetical protein
MFRARRVRALAACLGASGVVLALLMSAAPAHAKPALNDGSLGITQDSQGQDQGQNQLDWGYLNRDPRWKHHNKELPEPGTLGLFLGALLGAVWFLRARKPQDR